MNLTDAIFQRIITQLFDGDSASVVAARCGAAEDLTELVERGLTPADCGDSYALGKLIGEELHKVLAGYKKKLWLIEKMTKRLPR